MDVKRKELARKRRLWLRREEGETLDREEGETLDKKRKTALEQKHAEAEKRLAAEKTLELMRVEKQKAETLVLSLSWGTYVRRFGWGASAGHQSQITCAGFQPWGIRVSNHM